MVFMDTNLLRLIDSFQSLKVIVLGEAMLDTYLAGTSERLCREAPVPVVSVTEREHVPGGAANTAVNLHCLGSQVVFLSIVGDDPEGLLLLRSIEEYGVSTEHLLVHPSRSTLAKQRVIAASQMVVRFDQGSTQPLDAETEDRLIERLTDLYPSCDALVVSDYDYGVLTPRIIHALACLQAQMPRIVVVDSKRLPAYRDVKITAVKPNYNEALQMLGLQGIYEGGQACKPGERIAQIAAHGSKILDLSGAQIAAITLDQEGALVFARERPPYRTYARPEPQTRAAGAGDTFVSALALGLATGAHTENAVELASAAASIVVGKEGTAACFAEELRAFFSTDEKYITDAFQLAARMAAYRREKHRIVFTNGCFDILHRGHITYLNRAKAFGDVLIIGLNSDASVRRLKGASRPINNLEDRAQVLAALSCVDHIVAFDGDTPHELIRIIQPDVFVKGGDYTRQTLPEAALVEDLGGVVEILPYLEDRSTSGIIERIRKLGPDQPAKTQLLRSMNRSDPLGD